MKLPKKDELKELLIKGWMTHDGMWFYHCLQECGIETTNRINKAAIRAMSAIEIKRIQKAVGAGDLDTFDAFKQFFEITMQIVKGEFMEFTYSMPAKNMMHSEWRGSCFAYDGVKALGVIDRYECGIMLRIETWLDTLGIKYEVEPKVTGCMMHTDGKCFRDYRFFFGQ